MSRSQQGAVLNQTTGESKQAFGDAQNDYAAANQDIGNFQSQLENYATENPYKPGGEFQNAQNEVLANTSDASSAAAANRLQTQAQRTGQNPAGAIAATETMQQENERALSGEQAQANEERISGEAGYDKGVLQGYGEVPGMEAGVASGEAGLYKGALGAEEDSAKTPSFLDVLGDSFAQQGGKMAAQGIGAVIACWVAAELYGGWSDPRTKTLQAWFLGPANGSLLHRLYLRYGERLAEAIGTHRILRSVVKRFFDHLLHRAQKS